MIERSKAIPRPQSTGMDDKVSVRILSTAQRLYGFYVQMPHRRKQQVAPGP